MDRNRITVERDGKTLSVLYGVDPEQGFVASVFSDGKLVVAYFSIVTDYMGLSELLDVLVEVGSFEREQITEALTAVLLGTSEEGIDSPEVLHVVRIVRDLVTLAPVRRACV